MTAELVDTGLEIRPDDDRVVARLFVPGLEEVGPSGSRAAAVINRVALLPEEEVDAALADVVHRFDGRHRHLPALFADHAARVVTLLDPDLEVSAARLALIGACFTHEFSVEAAAICNPSMAVVGEDDDGTARFVISVRGIGEGHRSTIGFRTGSITADGVVSLDEPSPYATTVTGTPGLHHRSVFHARMDALGDDFTHVSRFLALLPPTFDDADLAEALRDAASAPTIHRFDARTMSHITELSRSSYVAEFPSDTDISERVLWPHAPCESQGMEDARLVRFVDDDGSITFLATYTAFDHTHVSIQLLETRDFVTFASSPVVGAAASGKGLAIFPRKVNGRFMALTRADRETNGIATSDDLRHWPTHQTLQVPQQSWEVVQLGNCGPPIETEQGWLVLTHGVGPMRTYSIGALLLDLDEPTHVLRRSRKPLIVPGPGRQHGYVPNVVYSCGAVAHRDTLVVPYGVGDQRIAFATASLSGLIDSMVPA
jgi:predicted GH43/DUF377 family glycosyl hydrolase